MSTNSWIECYGNCVVSGSYWYDIALKNIDDNAMLKTKNQTLSEENRKLSKENRKLHEDIEDLKTCCAAYFDEDVNLRRELDSLKEEHNKTLESYHQLLKESDIDEYLKLFKNYTNRGDQIRALQKELKEMKEKPEDSTEKDVWKERHNLLLDSYHRLLADFNVRGDRIRALQKELKEMKEKNDISDEEVKLFLQRLYDCFVGSTKNDTGLDCIASYMTLSSFTDAFSNLYTLIDDIVFDEHFYDVIYDFLEWARKDYYNKMIEKVTNKNPQMDIYSIQHKEGHKTEITNLSTGETFEGELYGTPRNSGRYPWGTKVEEPANKEAKYENYTTEV